MKLTDLQKTIAAAVFIGAVSISGFSYLSKTYALAADLQSAENEIKNLKEQMRLESLQADLERAKLRREAGIPGQDALIELLEKQIRELLERNNA